MASLVEQIKTAFIELDNDFTARQIEWAVKTTDRLMEYKKSEEYKIEMRKDVWRCYEKLFAMCGGKTWYRVFNDYSGNRIVEFVTKNCQAINDKRNETIAHKLNKLEVTEIINSEFFYTKDGFNGIYRVNTNEGNKRIEINTFVAGGYNVQCLHQRTTIKIK